MHAAAAAAVCVFLVDLSVGIPKPLPFCWYYIFKRDYEPLAVLVTDKFLSIPRSPPLTGAGEQ